MVYILLGLMPFTVEMLPESMRPNIEWRGVPFITGIFTTVIQFMAGVGGLFLDIFFKKSLLDRKTTNATKAITQTFSHVLRAAYFGSLAGVGDLKFVVWGPGIVLALVGAIAAPFVVERMTDHGFRQWTRGIIFTIAVVYLIRGGLLLWHGAVRPSLLARPDDARDPHHVLERQRAVGMLGIERFQLDLLGGLALELLDHHFAVLGLDHDAVAAPHRRRRRHDDDVAVAIGRHASSRRKFPAHRRARRRPRETRSRPSPCRPESRRRRNSRRRRPRRSRSAAPPAPRRSQSAISDTKDSTLTPVAASDLATNSVEGQRARPSGVMRFDLLKVVGSSPARLASPDGDSLARAASRSIAVQIWVCVSGALAIPVSGIRVKTIIQNIGIITLIRVLSSPTLKNASHGR